MAKGLTPQQRLFAVEIASGKTARDAAIAAGYSQAGADARASVLRKNPQVAAEIDRIMSKPLVASFGSKAEALDILWDSMSKARAGADWSAVRGLTELWLKAQGHLIERREVRQDTVCELDWSSTRSDDQ